jgi:ketopantoate reductase
MLGVVIELGEMTGVATPALKALYACVSLLNRKIQEESVYIKERQLQS